MDTTLSSDWVLNEDDYAKSELSLACLLTLLIPIALFPTVGKTTKDVSDKFWLRVNPPNAFFGIWGVIYVFADAAAIYCYVNDLWGSMAWVYFALSNATVGTWTIIYNQGTLTAVNISVIFEVILLQTNQLLWQSIIDNPKLQNTTGTLVANAFSFGQGWFIAATFLGLGATQVYYFGMSLNTQLVVFWATAPLLAEFTVWYNVQDSGSIYDSIGLIVCTLYAITGAAITSCTPLPRHLKEKEEREERVEGEPEPIAEKEE